MRLAKSRIFLIANFLFVSGIFIASYTSVRWIANGYWWLGAFLFFAGNAVIFYKEKKVFIVALGAAFLFLGLWRYSLCVPVGEINFPVSEINFQARVISEPVFSEKSQQLTAIILRPGESLNSKKILIFTNHYPRYNYGDSLEISGRIERPGKLGEFSYDRYLAKDKIYFISIFPQVKKTGNSGMAGKKYILRAKEKMRQMINLGLGEPAASLNRAIVLGDKRAVDSALKQKFANLGLSHLMAISGMHISVVILIVFWLLIYFGLDRKKAFYGVELALVVYIFMIGAPASAIRAGIMGSFVLLAMQAGRLNRASNSLLAAASLTLAYNPLWLRDDIGWQLSFLAVFGIIWFYPILKEGWQKFNLPERGYISDVLMVSLAAQILIWPLIAKNFNQVNILSPLANVFVVWTLPFVFFFSLAALVLSFLFPPAVIFWFLPVRLLFAYIINIAEAMNSYLILIWNIEDIWYGWILLYYFLALMFVWQNSHKKEKIDLMNY